MQCSSKAAAELYAMSPLTIGKKTPNQAGRREQQVLSASPRMFQNVETFVAETCGISSLWDNVNTLMVRHVQPYPCKGMLWCAKVRIAFP